MDFLERHDHEIFIGYKLMQQEPVIHEFLRGAIRDYAKNMDDFKKNVNENFEKINDKLSNLEKRFSIMEININFIKSIFSNYKVWISLFLFIIVLVALLDPHSILKSIKSAKEII